MSFLQSAQDRSGPAAVDALAANRLADALRLIEHSYRKLAQIDAVVARLVGSDPDLESKLAAIRTQAVCTAIRLIERPD